MEEEGKMESCSEIFSPSSNPFLLPGEGETTTVYFSRKRKNKGIFSGFDEMGKIATCSPFFWSRLFVLFEATRTEAARKGPRPLSVQSKMVRSRWDNSEAWAKICHTTVYLEKVS